MPSPAETKPEFDPLAFWIQHKLKLQLLLGLLVFGLVAYGIFQLSEKRSREAAESAFAAATTEEDFRKVIAAHPRSVVAANAQLMLAEQLRNAGKNDEAMRTLRAFIDKHPDHPLISGAWTSLAFSLEAQGKTEEALSTLQKVAATYPTSFSAPVALMAQARIYKNRGDAEQAKRIYEQVVSQFGQSDFAREALMESQKLKKESATRTKPATEVAPAQPAAAPPANNPPPQKTSGAENAPAPAANTPKEATPPEQKPRDEPASLPDGTKSSPQPAPQSPQRASHLRRHRSKFDNRTLPRADICGRARHAVTAPALCQTIDKRLSGHKLSDDRSRPGALV